MATTPSLKIVKTIPFKGGQRDFSNIYHFNGGTPADAAHWHTLMDAVTAAEKAIFRPAITIIEAIGYAAGSAVPVASKTYSLAGTLTVSAGNAVCPAEDAVLLRWSTTARSSKNHPVYLFNFFHGAINQQAGTYDAVMAAQVSAIDTFANDWVSGFSDGTLTCVRAGPNGATAVGHQTEGYVTHRDFPYTPSV